MLNKILIKREKDRVIEKMKNSQFPKKIQKALIFQLKKMNFKRIYIENVRKDYPMDYVQTTIIRLLKEKAKNVLATVDSVEVDCFLNDVVYGALPSS